MATTLTIQEFKVNFLANLRNDNSIAPASVGSTISLALALAQGTGAGEADVLYIARRDLAANTAENLDLSGTALDDPLGTDIAMARVKMILVKLNPSPAGGPLHVGGHATAAFGTFFLTATDLDTDQPRIIIRNGTKGGFFALGCTDATGYVVTATTEDLLTIKNVHSTLAVNYDIAVVGCSA